MTLLERLARKGIVSRRKSGRAFLYAPQVERDALRRIALREFLNTYFEGSEERLVEFIEAQRGGRPPQIEAAFEPEPRLDTALL